MVVADVIPNVDIDAEWSTWGAGATHEERIDEDKGAPDTADAIVCDPGENNLDDTFHMDDTIQDCDEYTQVKVYFYLVHIIGEGTPCTVDIYVNGGWVGVQNIPTQATVAWQSVTFAGLSGNQASLDALQVKCSTTTLVAGKYTDDIIRIFTMYAEITYSEAVAEGWGHKFIGVAGANIANVNGVPIANIGKIKGVGI